MFSKNISKALYFGIAYRSWKRADGETRRSKESVIDPKAGIRFYFKTGEYVEKGEVLAELYASDQEKLKDAVKYLKTAYQYSDAAVTPMEEIIGYVTRDCVQQRIIE